MKRATIEVLEEGEMILGSNPVGRYMVTEFEDNVELGGMFFESLADAEEHIENICNTVDDWFFQFFLRLKIWLKTIKKGDAK